MYYELYITDNLGKFEYPYKVIKLKENYYKVNEIDYGYYKWFVIGYDEYGVCYRSDMFSFNYSPKLPDEVILLEPKNDATFQSDDIPIEFKWDNSDDVSNEMENYKTLIYYTLEISKDKNFEDDVFVLVTNKKSYEFYGFIQKRENGDENNEQSYDDDGKEKDSSGFFTQIKWLEHGTYYWRVVAKYDRFCESEHSDIFTFTYEDVTCKLPEPPVCCQPPINPNCEDPEWDELEILTPMCDKGYSNGNLIIAWTNIECAYKYQIEISKDENFSSIEENALVDTLLYCKYYNGRFSKILFQS